MACVWGGREQKEEVTVGSRRAGVLRKGRGSGQRLDKEVPSGPGTLTKENTTYPGRTVLRSGGQQAPSSF